MATKSKAREPAKRGQTAKKEEKPQGERFIDAARDLDVTEDGFERLFKKVVPSKKVDNERS